MSGPERQGKGKIYPAPGVSEAAPSGVGGADQRRPRVDGKFLFLGDTKLWVRGVTYGTFAADGYPDPGTVGHDLRQAVEAGVNALRVYTVPPRWLLDLAHRFHVRVLVGLPWEQHITFLEDRERQRSIEQRVRAGVAACAGHRGVLGYAIGSEIPASIIRWYGPRRVERFLRRLYDAAKDTDPDAIVTYVNFPSTEYLELPFVDAMAFNVYLEEPSAFARYLARLHVLAGDRPLLITELGLDSQRHGEEVQALAVGEQLQLAVDGGCAGAFTFSWTDEWVRDGIEVDDWSFGLVDRQRRPKPALAAAHRAHRRSGRPHGEALPPVSVVVCTHNGARTLAECLGGIAQLNYPTHEVIVVDDGSTDATEQVAASFGVRVISGPQRGLSAARNTGIAAATGEIVAFLDDDCRPERDWLRHLVGSLRGSDHAGVGGPNVPPGDEGVVARCVARAPGGPTHVLLSDTQAEHIAGCNMAFRRDRLLALGGFDERFWQAGDDVDLCWRVADAGHTLGFSPAALVWHRRRRSVIAYLTQQRSYGRAEALLERKWPERYNGCGHVTWRGRMYSTSVRHRRRVHYGIWGTALFQQAVEPRPWNPSVAAMMPEWYLLFGVLALLAALAPWMPLLRVPPLELPFMPVLFALFGVLFAGRAFVSARRLECAPGLPPLQHVAEPALVALLVLLQPLARLSGRLRAGLTPWRRNAGIGPGPIRTRVHTVWCEHGALPQRWLSLLEAELKADGAAVMEGGAFDRWDLRIRVGAVGAARVQMAVEEHGRGRQQLRFRVSPYVSPRIMAVAGALLGMTAVSLLAGSIAALVLFGSAGLLVAARAAADSAEAGATVAHALSRWQADVPVTAPTDPPIRTELGDAPLAAVSPDTA